jgi:hypothetical protein
MTLVGMLDSPFVRRVAISLQLLGLRYPRLAAFSAAAEALPESMAAPYGETTYRQEEA